MPPSEEDVPTGDGDEELDEGELEPEPELPDPDEDFVAATQPVSGSFSRPDISWLDDAVDWDAKTSSGVNFVLKKGDYVVIERYCLALATKPWLDTRVYRLMADPKDDGELSLWDPVNDQQASSNWKVGLVEGFQFRIPPRGRNPETLFETKGGRRRRSIVRAERPRVYDESLDALRVARKEECSRDSAPAGATEPKKRGRPAGSTNRPKEVIEAEKAERRRLIEERRAARAARKRR